MPPSTTTRSSSNTAAGPAPVASVVTGAATSNKHSKDKDNDGTPTSRRAGLRKRPTTSAAAAAQSPKDQVPPPDLKQKQEQEQPDAADRDGHHHDDDMSFSARNRWVLFAVASGVCAACNGVFAKLTTNDLTTTIAKAINHVFGLSAGEAVIELIVRVIFFSLNLVFNGVMWTLFTQALAKGNSTTQVTIMNTSTNFMITALLGFVIFSESLPPLWWAGAALLVAGNVIIGRKDEEGRASGHDEADGDGPRSTDPLLGERRDHDDSDDDASIASLRGDLESGMSTPPLADGLIPIEKEELEDEDIAQIDEIDEPEPA